MQKKLPIIIGGGLVALLLVGAIVLLSGDGSSSGGSSGGGKPVDPFAMPSGSSSLPSGAGKIPAHRAVADYKAWAVYPPDSRPLLKAHLDTVQPKIIHESPQRMHIVDPTTKRPKHSDHYCMLQPATHTAVGKENHRIFLKCIHPPARKAVKLEITEFYMQRRVADKVTRLPQPTVGDGGTNGDATAGDGIYTFQWRPRSSDWGQIELNVRFNIPGEEKLRTYQLLSSFFSSPSAPAVFAGRFTESLKDGSLIIGVKLRVKTPGDYEIKGNLFHEDGRPVAVAKATASLRPGLQTMQLRFFGKIFHDRETAGRYVLKSVRGIRHNLPFSPSELARLSPEEVQSRMKASLKSKAASQPDRQLIPYYNGEYKTGTYRLDQFSKKEWQSPEKQRRIKMLQEQKN